MSQYKLRINADDAGLHPDIDSGILACAKVGMLTSVSVMSLSKQISWPRIAEMADNGVGIGIHLTFVDEPWLTTGKAISRNMLFFKAFSSPSFLTALKQEAELQIETLALKGFNIIHADSHQHVHVFPGIANIVDAVTKQYGIAYVRCPMVAKAKYQRENFQGKVLQQLATNHKAMFNGYAVSGIKHAGNNTIHGLLGELERPNGNMELVIHPGNNTQDLLAAYGKWRYNWSAEKDLLLNPKFADMLVQHGYEIERLR